MNQIKINPYEANLISESLNESIYNLDMQSDIENTINIQKETEIKTLLKKKIDKFIAGAYNAE